MAGLYNLKRDVATGDELASIAATDVSNQYAVASANGAISIPATGRVKVFITKGTAAVLTLAAPTATTHDGVEIVFISTTAAAHTVTATTIGFNAGDAASDVGTFGGAIGDGFSVTAYQGEWYVTNSINVTLA